MNSGENVFWSSFFIILTDSLFASDPVLVNPTLDPKSEARLWPMFEVSIISVFLTHFFKYWMKDLSRIA